jgi:hypothetical protein
VWAKWEMSREESEGEESVEMGEQVAGQSRYRIVSGGGGEEEARLPSEHGPIASGLNCRACIDLRSLTDLFRRFLE